MHHRVARYDRRVPHLRWLAAPIGDDATSFAHEQDAGSHVPRGKRQLPKCVEATAGHIGEIERGGAGTPDPRDRGRHGREAAQILVDLIGALEWDTSAD